MFWWLCRDWNNKFYGVAYFIICTEFWTNFEYPTRDLKFTKINQYALASAGLLSSSYIRLLDYNRTGQGNRSLYLRGPSRIGKDLSLCFTHLQRLGHFPSMIAGSSQHLQSLFEWISLFIDPFFAFKDVIYLFF